MSVEGEARMPVGDQFTFRRFTEADLEGIYALYLETPEVARDLGDGGVEALREQLKWPGHEPTRDRWVVALRDNPQRLVGHGSVFKSPNTPRADLLVITHPEVRRQGLGSELLRRAQADAHALGATNAAIYVNDRDVDAVDFVRRRGFVPVGAFTDLVAAGERQFAQAEWPAGFSVRAWRDESDLATLTEAANRGYEGLWGHNHTTPEEWAQWLPTMDTHGIFFLFGADGAVVGMARGRSHTTKGQLVGVVDAPGVVEEWRGAGLYRPLLLHTLGWLAAQRPAEYTIESWSDAPAILDDYHALGFETRRRETLFQRALEPLPRS